MKRVVDLCLVSVLAVLLLSSGTAQAKLSKSDRKEAKAMFSGTLYMRMDAPCATGRHAYGTYMRPLVEVSPEGSSDNATENEVNAGWWHADSTYWGILINDPVEFSDMSVDDDTVEIELEGVGSAKGNETAINFIEIETLEDFKQAFAHAFSSVPLQDTHADWSPEVKEAIGERKLIDGMTKRQAFYVTGAPKSFEKKDEGGVEVEIWTLRVDRGMKLGYWGSKSGETTGLPTTIRFEDGVLVDAPEVGSSSEFSLD